LDILKELIRRYDRHRIHLISGTLAFFFLLSLFPLLIFLNALLGTFGLQLLDLIQSMEDLIPQSALDVLAGYVTSISSTSTGLISFSLLATLYSASIAVTSLIHSIHTAYNQYSHRHFVTTKLWSLFFTLLIGIALTSSLVLPALGRNFLTFVSQYITISEGVIVLWTNLRWILTAAIITATLALLYKVIPYTPYKKQSVWPGAVFSLIGWMVVSLLFSIYVNNYANYSLVYGPLGAVIALMIWLFITGMIIILGAELNSILDTRRNKKLSLYVKVTEHEIEDDD
jgi:membrane protein